MSEDSATPKPRKRQRLLWFLLIALVGLSSGLWVWSRDDDPVEDEDLRRDRVVTGAYAELASLIEDDYAAMDAATEKVKEEYYLGDPLPREVFDPHLRLNEKAFARIRERVRSLDLSQAPGGALTMDEFSRFWEVVDWLHIGALTKAEDGNGEGALDDIETGMALGKIMERVAGDSTDWMLVQALRHKSLTTFLLLVQKSGFDESALSELARVLDALRFDLQGLVMAYRGDYCFTLDIPLISLELLKAEAYDGPAQGLVCWTWDSPVQALFYKPNRTRRLFADCSRRRIASIEGKDLSPESKLSGPELLLSGNPVGRSWFQSEIPFTDHQFYLKFHKRGRLYLDLLKTVVAAHRFLCVEKRWPTSLTELVPRFLSAVPTDWDGEPIRYRSDWQAVYSVWRDGVDDSVGVALRKDSKDIVFDFETATKSEK